MFTRLVILVAVIQTLNGIKDDLKCPFEEGGWKTREKIFNCKEGYGLTYHCLLDINGHPLEACMKRKRYQRNGCPWIFQRDVNYFLGEPLTPCQNRQYCPSKGKRFYSNELYLYPACLVKREERWNFTLPDRNSSSTRNSTHQKYQRDEIPYERILLPVLALYVSGMIIQIIIPLCCKNKKQKDHKTVNDFEGRKRLLHVKNKGEEKIPQFSTPLVHIVTTSPRSDRNEEESSGESDSLSSTEDLYHWECSSSIGTEAKAITEDLFYLVRKGNEGDLKNLLLLQHKKIKKKHRADITVQDIKEAICLWIKLWDRPQPLDNFNILLVQLDNCSSLCELLLEPDKYKASIPMLLYAGRLGRKETVSFLLDKRPHTTLHMVDKDKNTILHHVVAMKSLDLVKKVLQLDSSLLDEVNIDRQTAFIMAVKSGCEDIVDFLLQEKAKVIDENDSFETITEESMKNNWSKIFENILSQKKDLLLTFKGDHDPCHKFQAGKVVRRLLELYIDDKINLVELASQAFPDMFTSKAYYLEQHPLIWVVGTRNENAIKLMLSKANPEDLVSAVDSNHRTILHLCIHKRISVDILKNEQLLLILNTRDSSNNSPIMYAAKLRHKKYFDELLQIEAVTLTDRDKTGKTILHVTVKNNWCKKSEKLLNHRDKDALLRGDERNVTPLMLAVSLLREPRFIKLLLDNGSEISDRDHVGKTLFHYFAENSKQKNWEDRKKCIDVLLEFEKFKKSRHLLKVRDFNGRTPIDIAREKEDHECCKLFEENLYNEEDKEKEQQCNGVD